jgi:hypothetical protein
MFVVVFGSFVVLLLLPCLVLFCLVLWLSCLLVLPFQNISLGYLLDIFGTRYVNNWFALRGFEEEEDLSMYEPMN